MEKKFLVLIKFSKKEHIESLQKEGRLYCQPLRYFTTCESETGRGDSLEAVTEMQFLEDAIIHMKDVDAPDEEFKSLGTGSGHLIFSPDTLNGNIFCLYSIFMTKDTLADNRQVLNDCKKFGEYYLVITNPSEFLKRIGAKACELGIKLKYDLIQYRDFSKYSGKKTIFEKDLLYSYQQEFRIFFETEGKEVLNLVIGSIEDISEISYWDDDNLILNFFDNDSTQ